MIVVEKKALAHAVEMAYLATRTGSHPSETWARVFGSATSCGIMGSGAVATYRQLPSLDFKSGLDVCVYADRLRAAMQILDDGPVLISVPDENTFRIEQRKTVDITFESKPSSEFAHQRGFDDMTAIAMDLPNPYAAFKSVQHAGVDNVGNTPLANVLIILKDASYLVSTMGAVRCEGTLTQGNDPIALTLDSLAILELMGPKVHCHLDQSRVVVSDTDGWVCIRRWSGEYLQFAKTVVATFASLRQVGTVKVNRRAFMESAIAALTVLKGMSKDALFLMCECHKEKMTVSASVGRHSYRQELPASSSSGYKIPIHAGRAIAFLRNSEDEDIYLQVMDSDLVPSPRNAVHLLDARLHEVMSLPAARPIEDLV